MAIPAPLAKIMLHEHKHRPISGNILSLGRQTILFDEMTMQQMMSECDMKPRSVGINIDRITIEANLAKKEFLLDSSFYSAFTDASYHIMDVTDYEGATIIHDLCTPPPNDLIGQFDFIFNGSVLDNIFDPAAALRHITRLLATNGRVMHIEMASNLAFEYLIYSPDWFLDYYVLNGFQDCRVYICTFADVESLKFGPWELYQYHPREDGNTACSLREIVTQHAVIVVIAEKNDHSTYERSPIQWCYRNEEMKRQYAKAYARLQQQEVNFAFDDIKETKINSGFTYLGTIQQ